jgi:hypothetical protein
MHRRNALVLVIIALALSACSTGAYDVHAYTALSLRDAADGMGSSLREHHRSSLRAAVAAVPEEDPAGCVIPPGRRNPELICGYHARQLDAIRAADEAWRADHAGWLDAHRTAARASRAYSSSAYAGLRGDGGDPGTLVRIGLEALRALSALADTLRRSGVEVPELPDGIGDLLGGM